MFYLSLVVAFTTIFCASLISSELFLTSSEERRLPPSVRLTAGYVLMVAYFAAALQVMPVSIAWTAGVGLVILYLAGHRRTWLAERWHLLVASKRLYLRTYALFFVLANVLLLPLHISGTYGPFTEGGGDVSIYADTAKYVDDHQIAIWGLDSALRRLEPWLGVPGSSIEALDDPVSLAAFDPRVGNPPNPEYAAYRVAITRKYPSALLSPIAQWPSLFDGTNYPFFYAALAFQYACLIVCIVSFLGSYVRIAIVLGALILLGSHGLASVFYNVYFLQATCLMISALVISVLPRMPLFSVAALRTLGPGVAIIVCSYLHFASVIAPLFLTKYSELLPAIARARQRPRVAWLRPPLRTWPTILAAAMLGVLLSIWLLTGLSVEVASYIGPLRQLFGTAVRLLGSVGASGGPINWLGNRRPGLEATADIRIFFGDAITPGSQKWLTFVFGSLSQQHYPPFATLPARLEQVAHVTSFAGAIATVIGLVTAAVVWIRSRARWLIFYACAWLVVLAHLAITQSSLYVQAKGAQDILVVLYALVLLLPFAAFARTGPPTRSPARTLLTVVWAVTLFAFGMGLATPRLYFAARLAQQQDRSSILEDSFFTEARRIQSADRQSFVLFEPRTSSDLYLGNQAFFGFRMVPTRHLVLARLNTVTQVESNLKALDFVDREDLQNLWLLESTGQADAGGCLVRAHCGGDVWHAVRLAQVPAPELLLSGNQYERFFEQRPRTSGSELAWFSHVNVGSAALVLPPHPDQARRISVLVRPVDSSEAEKFSAAVQFWLRAKAVVPETVASASDGSLELEYSLPPDAAPRLVPLVGASGDFLCNVRVDGQELQPSLTTVTVLRPIRVGEPVIVKWDGVRNPAPDDWIGVFPVNGRDGDRLSFVFTGGAASGNTIVPVPPTFSPGVYELRLYGHGGWQQLAGATFAVLP